MHCNFICGLSDVIIIIIIIIMFVYWRLSNATNTEQWNK